MSDTPNVQIPYVPEGTLDPAAGLNLALNVIDALVQTGVIRMDLSAPPGSESDGDMYIVASPGSGDWALQGNNLARYVAEGDFWQFYAAGTQVKFLLNQDDGGFYKFIDGSPGAWTLAAGLDDAPSDGLPYLRQDGAWVVSLTIEQEDSPAVEVTGVTRIVLGAGFTLSEDTSGVARIEGGGGGSSFASVVTEAGASRTAQSDQSNTYVRFTNAAAKTYLFDDAEAYTVGHEFHGRNVGAGDLTIEGTTGMTINPPAGGSNIVPQDGTFTVKIVASGEADLFGVTVQQT